MEWKVETALGAAFVASIASVFDKSHYKAWARLSGLLAITLLAGAVFARLIDGRHQSGTQLTPSDAADGDLFGASLAVDSGTLVVTTMQSGGHTEPPILERVQWGVGIGAVTAALLIAGGLGALQAMAIAAALPFAVVLVALGVGFMAALHEDANQQCKARRARKSRR